MSKPMLSIREVANELGVSYSTVRNKVRARDWNSVPKPTAKVGSMWRWNRDTVTAFKAGHRIEHKTANKNNLPASFAKYM